MIQIAIGLNAEGVTDYRFLKDIIYRTFSRIIACECDIDIEILDIFDITVPKNKTTFKEAALNATLKGTSEYGVSVMCIHADADNHPIDYILENKFSPLWEAIKLHPVQNCCKIIVPVIPIKMTEAWMMADKDLLKKAINAKDMKDEELGLNKKPETYRDPKEAINKAISIAANQNQRKRIRNLSIGPLYEEMGGLIAIEALEELPSYLAFANAVREALRKLNYLH